MAHRTRCTDAANKFVSCCSSNGIDVVIFGSLTNQLSFFRENSDVDICIMDSGKYSYRDIENMARQTFGDISFDLWLRQDLKPEILIDVINNGVRHVD